MGPKNPTLTKNVTIYGGAMNFLKEVYTSPKFQKLLKDNPEAAKLMFQDYQKRWMAIQKDFVGYRELMRKANTGIEHAEGKGKLIATIPELLIQWLKFERGDISSKEIYEWVKTHKEFLVVDKI